MAVSALNQNTYHRTTDAKSPNARMQNTYRKILSKQRSCCTHPGGKPPGGRKKCCINLVFVGYLFTICLICISHFLLRYWSLYLYGMI